MVAQKGAAIISQRSGILSARLQTVQPSATLSITQIANELRRQGRDVIGLSQGEPDFDTPDHIKRAAKAAIDAGLTKYTDVDGTPELKQAVVSKFRRENGLSYDLNQISVSAGGKQIIFNAFCASLNSGDEVIIPAPYWVSYPDMVQLAGGVPKVVPCPEANGFKLTAASLRRAITPLTKWLIINSPGNPTGSSYSHDDLRSLADVLLDYPHVLILTDDIYEHIRYDGRTFSTIGAVEPKLKDRVLTCNGLSKAYAMTGWRIGYAGGPTDLIRAMAIIQSQSTTNPCSISQAAAIAALNGPLDFIDERNQIFEQRRNLSLDALERIDGLSCRKPDGAFYLFPCCEGVLSRKRPDGRRIDNDVDFSTFLLEEANVAVVPGSAFGLASHFRISYATATDRLSAACDRISNACATLR